MSTSTRLDVTTRERYLKRMRDTSIALAVGQDINVGPIEAWAKRGLEKLAEQGRLITEQQFLDHRQRRLLRVGDAVAYVGPDRDERTNDGTAIVRPHGQTGRVIDVKRHGGEFLITFRPDATAATARVVDLVVRTNTPGYFSLERIVNLPHD